MKKILVFISVLCWCGCAEKGSQPEVCDVLVVGGGASGVMAGIQSARLGSYTIIIEETPWLGGMLTAAGVSAIDGNYRLFSGLWQEFRERLYMHYGGEDSVKTGWVSSVLFEPNVGDHLLKEMAGAEENLEVMFEIKVQSLEFVDNVWQVQVTNHGKTSLLKAKIVIDATELGDISKMVGIPYDIGMDSRYDTSEEIAPEMSNDIVQDLTYVAILKDYGNEEHLLKKPVGYDPTPFYCTCAGICNPDSISRTLWPCDKMMQYGRLPNNKYMINWPIYGNDFYANVIESSDSERQQAYEKAKWYTKCFVYYLQHELGYEHLGIVNDVFPTVDGFPFYPYHRESRRIKGVVRFDINDLDKPFQQEDALYRTGIAVGDYPIDHHHAAYHESENLPDLHFYPVPSYTLPLGTLIPKRVKNFIVAEKSISVTNLVNGTTRLQPVCLLIGQAAGVLAHLSAQGEKTPREIGVRTVQEILLDNGAYIMPYSDVVPGDPAFASVQRIGATGILKGEGVNIGWENHTLFHPDTVLTYSMVQDGFMDFDNILELNPTNEGIKVSEASRLLKKYRKQLDAKYHVNENMPSINLDSIWDKHGFGKLEKDKEISRKQFAVLLDKMIDPFHLKQIDHFGMYLD